MVPARYLSVGSAVAAARSVTAEASVVVGPVCVVTIATSFVGVVITPATSINVPIDVLLTIPIVAVTTAAVGPFIIAVISAARIGGGLNRGRPVALTAATAAAVVRHGGGPPLLRAETSI